MFGLSFVGLALLAYFKHHPLPAGVASDKILPYFMSQAFPRRRRRPRHRRDSRGVAVEHRFRDQLVHARSSWSTSTAGCSQPRRAAGTAPTPTGPRVAASRQLVFGLRRARCSRPTSSRIGTLLEIANKLINAFSGPLFGIYLLAMFSRRATERAGARRRHRRAP